MHAVSFYFMVYKFVKIHKSIKTTSSNGGGSYDLPPGHGRCCDDGRHYGVTTHQVAGLVIVVPGIGLGNWLAASAQPRIGL